MARIPLRHTVGLRTWSAGPEDTHGNPTDVYSDPVETKVYGWGPPIGRERRQEGVASLSVDLELFVPPTWSSAPEDRIVVDGKEYGQVGDVMDYNHGPFGMQPGGVVQLHRAE